MKKLRLKGGELGMSEGVFEADLVIEGGRIKEFLKRDEDLDGDYEIVDCTGKLILPGMIDVHVHFREPGATYKEDWTSGSAVAVSGGVTTVFDMPNNQPPIVSVKALKAKRALVAGRSYVNYGFFMGFNGENLDEILKARGICGVKWYMANSTGDMGVSEGARELFEKFKGPIVVHAEDEAVIAENLKSYGAEVALDVGGLDGAVALDVAVHSKIRSVEAAVVEVRRVCELARAAGRGVHIAHISCADELEVINEYEEVTCEVAPHHLMFCVDDYEAKGALIKMNPPVRERGDVFAMWKGLKFGEIDIVATDHAPHTLEEKQQEYLKAPSGVPGVGYALPILLNAVNDEGLSVSELVRLCCERPAEIFGVKNKGKLEDGYDADIVVVDMDLEREIIREDVRDKCGWSPYEGLTLKGWPVMTFVGGELVWRDGKVMGEPGGREVF